MASYTTFMILLSSLGVSSELTHSRLRSRWRSDDIDFEPDEANTSPQIPVTDFLLSSTEEGNSYTTGEFMYTFNGQAKSSLNHGVYLKSSSDDDNSVSGEDDEIFLMMYPASVDSPSDTGYRIEPDSITTVDKITGVVTGTYVNQYEQKERGGDDIMYKYISADERNMNLKNLNKYFFYDDGIDIHEYGEVEIIDDVTELISSKVRLKYNVKEKTAQLTLHRQVQASQDEETCLKKSIVELAVVFDSSYCAHFDYDEYEASSTLLASLYLSSLRYEQAPLCTMIKVSYVEGYCDGEVDPYKEGVALNQAGCTSQTYGLKDFVSDYWYKNRKEIHRDGVLFISGTPLECSAELGGCVGGCASKYALYDKRKGYAIMNLMFLSTIFEEEEGGNGYNTQTISVENKAEHLNIQAVMISHELGHLIGSTHDALPDGINPKSYVMQPFISDALDGFSAESMKSMQCGIKDAMCVEKCKTI